MDLRGPLLALLLAAASGCALPGAGDRTLEDDLGRPVDVSRLDRILPTSVDLVEALLALGHGDRILAVPDWIDSDISCVAAPEGAEHLPQYGRPHVISAEEVVALQPDLVLLKDHPLQGPGLATQLEQAGLAVFVFSPTETVENLHHTMQTVAKILEPVDADAPARAEQRIAAFDAEVQAVADAIATRPDDPEPRALFQLPAGIVAGGGTTANLLIDLAAATDVAASLGLTGYKQISPESLSRGDPERVIVSCTAAGSPEELFGQPRYSSTTAALLAPESMRVVDPGVAALIGLRFPQGLRDVAQWLHPAAFGLVTPNVTMELDGRALHVDANASMAQEGPLRFRLLPGDGSDAVDDEDGRFDHQYPRAGTFYPRLLIIDGQGRVHEHRQMFSVP